MLKLDGKVALGVKNVDSSKCTLKFCTWQQICPSYHVIDNTKGSPFTLDGHASPRCCLIHLGNDMVELVITY